MPQWRTEIPLLPNQATITRPDWVYALGSCFSEHMSSKLTDQKFAIRCNDAGVLYNPISMAAFIQRMANLEPVDSQHIFYYQGLYRHRMLHSKMSFPNKGDLEDSLGRMTIELHDYFKQMKWCLLTPGTAWVYTEKETGVLMGNNHKLPAVNFNKRLLHVEEIVEAFRNAIASIKAINPVCQFILTLSPIRHIKDGMVENARSKGILLEALHQVVEKEENVDYFPAYEIMMDDLRDYRFYADDLLHPNTMAIDYIWEKFQLVYMHNDDQVMYQAIADVQQAAAHRLLHPESNESKAFLQTYIKRIEQLKSLYPQINWDREWSYFNELFQSVSGSAKSSGSNNN